VIFLGANKHGWMDGWISRPNHRTVLFIFGQFVFQLEFAVRFTVTIFFLVFQNPDPELTIVE